MSGRLGIEAVVKVGGSLARDPAGLGLLMRALARSSRFPLVVPGGGALADAVRAVHASAPISERTGHRMALLSLDQMGLWLTELAGGEAAARLVHSPAEAIQSAAGGRLPVMAPFRWLEREDPLPASWEVTSDSIAAWAAGRLGARRLLLLKSFAFRDGEVSQRGLGDAVDGWFLRTLPSAIECRFVDGRDVDVAVAAVAEGGRGTLLRRGAESEVVR